MSDASLIVSEFVQMALDDDPVSRETNMTVAASLMSDDERSRARQAANSMLAYLKRAERTRA